MILKLKRTPGIYLVGFMGCGKSTVGRALADELGWSFVDLDEEIEKAAGTSVARSSTSAAKPNSAPSKPKRSRSESSTYAPGGRR